ncbi:MAG TPA: maleylpyruvate isomerase N-terminal domain-containing protein, partial [Thermoanaerobaculia bacterium]|nr:maleylpyruvate isomerase N-terminal domain-containing protein [Thermoanaerobaculia bacterium]
MSQPLAPLQPLFVADLFPGLHRELIDLLRGLSEEDWDRPTVARRWRVRDIAAHLLDGDLRRLSLHRDRVRLAPPEPPVGGYDDLVRYLDHLNTVWVEAAQRISPRLLVELLEVTGPQISAFLASLDPFEPAIFPVAWAGEEASPNWFDVAREYTERWHHQAQIRDAVGAPGLLSRRWLHPLLDASVRALPHAYRGVEAPEGAAVVLEVTGEAGEAGGMWTLLRRAAGGELFQGEDAGA